LENAIYKVDFARLQKELPKRTSSKKMSEFTIAEEGIFYKEGNSVKQLSEECLLKTDLIPNFPELEVTGNYRMEFREFRYIGMMLATVLLGRAFQAQVSGEGMRFTQVAFDPLPFPGEEYVSDRQGYDVQLVLDSNHVEVLEVPASESPLRKEIPPILRDFARGEVRENFSASSSNIVEWKQVVAKQLYLASEYMKQAMNATFHLPEIFNKVGEILAEFKAQLSIQDVTFKSTALKQLEIRAMAGNSVLRFFLDSRFPFSFAKLYKEMS
jgi:hypothetical protein